MARRGDVVVVRRRLGFDAEGSREHFVVIQSDRLEGLDTVLVLPLDADGDAYADDPLVVHITAKEAGKSHPQVVLVHLVSATRWDRFDDGVAGRLRPASLAKVGELLALAQELD